MSLIKVLAKAQFVWPSSSYSFLIAYYGSNYLYAFDAFGYFLGQWELPLKQCDLNYFAQFFIEKLEILMEK